MADPIEIANSKTSLEFIEAYLPSSSEWQTWSHPVSKTPFSITLSTAKELSTEDFEACYQLIEFTSAADYKASESGWKPRAKRCEMKLLDLKYLLVKESDEVKGFLSLMPTYEDDIPVLYCYEIHLASDVQGTGLGSFLLKNFEFIGSKIPSTEKTMLTCFLSNLRGVQFYERNGYSRDEFSPLPRVLRNGRKLEVDYVILSKAISR